MTVRFVLFFIAVALTTTSNAAQAEELKLGDKGYRHTEFHEHYQKVFTTTSCHCSTGECRPTDWKVGTPPKGPYTSFFVKVDGEWCPVRRDAMLEKKQVPPELWVDPAHVCAYDRPAKDGSCRRQIGCVRINDGA